MLSENMLGLLVFHLLSCSELCGISSVAASTFRHWARSWGGSSRQAAGSHCSVAESPPSGVLSV